MSRFVRIGAGVLLAGLCLTIADARPPQSALRGLSEQDMATSGESGCQITFTHGNNTLIFMIGHDILMRGAQGLQTCSVTDQQFGDFGSPTAAVSCGGRSLRVRRTGRIVSHEESDSSESPAMLTITQGHRRQTIRGVLGAAC